MLSGAASVRPAVLPQLTSLRYFAAFAVMLSHLDFLTASPNAATRLVYTRLFEQGYCGVSFFFVLSGFIVTHAYRDALVAGRITPGVYMLRRAARIFPMHWLVAVPFIAWVVTIKGAPFDPLAIVLNLLLLHSWAIPGTLHFSFNGPSWSLSDEMFFYALLPALVLVRPRRLALAFVAGVLVVTVFALRAAMTTNIYSPTVEWLFYVNPVTRLIEFVGGMLVYHAWRVGYFARLSGTVAEVGLLALVPVCMVGFDWIGVPMPLRYQLAYLPLMMMLVFVFAAGRGRVSRRLSTPGLVLLGQASFTLYLIHRPIFTLAHQLAGQDAGTWLGAGLIGGCTLASVLVHLHVERPIDRRLRIAIASHFPAPGVRAGLRVR